MKLKDLFHTAASDKRSSNAVYAPLSGRVERHGKPKDRTQKGNRKAGWLFLTCC